MKYNNKVIIQNSTKNMFKKVVKNSEENTKLKLCVHFIDVLSVLVKNVSVEQNHGHRKNTVL